MRKELKEIEKKLTDNGSITHVHAAGDCPMDGVCKDLIDKPKPAVKV